MINRVTKKESKIARQKAASIVKYLRKTLRTKYIFADRLVGSARWNIILKDKNGMYDLDIQLLLTKKSKDSLDSPTSIKDTFFNCLNDKYKNSSTITVQNSTTAITFIDKEHKYSLDFVLIKMNCNKNEIIRRNNDDSDITINRNTWNILPKYNDAYSEFKKMSPNQKQDVIENHILPKKQEEKKKGKDNPTYKSSSQIFIEEVNNYVARIKNNRL